MAVGITLELIARPGTPQAPRSASSVSFCNNYFKLCSPNLTRRQRMTIAILGLVHSSGASPYVTNHQQLIKDTQVWNGALSAEFQTWAALAAIDWTSGKEGDAAFSADVPTILKEGRDLENLDEDTLFGIYAFMRATINA